MDNKQKALLVVGGLGLAGLLTWALTRKGKAAPPPIPPPPSLANLYGIVADSLTGQPLSGVLVILDTQSTQTNTSGYYEFLNLSPGIYSVTFSKEGYQTLIF